MAEQSHGVEDKKPKSSHLRPNGSLMLLQPETEQTGRRLKPGTEAYSACCRIPTESSTRELIPTTGGRFSAARATKLLQLKAGTCCILELRSVGPCTFQRNTECNFTQSIAGPFLSHLPPRPLPPTWKWRPFHLPPPLLLLLSFFQPREQGETLLWCFIAFSGHPPTIANTQPHSTNLNTLYLYSLMLSCFLSQHLMCCYFPHTSPPNAFKSLDL